ncbi:MAG TPA: bifunctional diaminohydroxyphosphoribosylaminopyrimidine deaminase/5-amino-6-(5-phosphoribosylamino)uracil reductase RibD [Balneola sp.]|jgi:diaminohydroxyphosphoribosylaminopyrimidine deaminase/5-amino-6-(5-phosphoribosylamino)uracil reductase|nr:riboflavin biosynthesis protein RibD [Balneola sp.]MAO77932.1 riboflavin biosynthesis protein RibD [Balneola sp.]MBF65276.1 riboflavin biosynthesis protein RibD [Balneola sp.]HAW81829.1 bifunctional diaminohydroxyphosphoribosylaminopyrimidine deaminase/5-amino-6-(5-phosphoribosylamino)uracil reductase RibD [Balneola sp.]HBZ37578.1 bifunctional diaminohydroxyphosphoribosylaminopyrimidine deaminase/5-amino-6-(5-phosphoribosylamino)uracil reductase RibD [Balneola sp.]|tara:strand:- start:27955 stop:29079 length:1125 start_codon:yes stop_codon:yes gene_type:complete
MQDQQKTHHKWMKEALELASLGKGYVSPNPLVGCVVVDNKGNKIGEGFHKKFGESHAEVNAISSITNKELLSGATVYVTLEPCSHIGKTPPCADMLAALPLKEVIIAMKDPNPKVNGNGIRILKNAGIKVQVGILESEAEKLNEFFIHHQNFGRPFITLKIAQTADGFLAAADGDSQWISGKQSRKKVHEWRAEYDAVLIGRTTAMADNPSLTVRHIKGRQPKRIVIDGPFELPRDLNVFSDKYEERTTILTWNKEKSKDAADPMLKVLSQNYFRGEIIQTSQKDGHVDLREAFKLLGKSGISSVLVEGGQQLSSALIRQGLVDKICLFIAPKLLGSGTRSVLDIGINKMSEIIGLKEVCWEKVGDDMLLTGYF